MRKIKPSEKKKFYEIVKELHNEGLPYIEVICKVMDMCNIKDDEIAKLVDAELREKIKKEAMDKHLVKCERALNLESLFYGEIK
jgi:tRNA(Ser,Leu) C12 N-acetylase TAN1